MSNPQAPPDPTRPTSAAGPSFDVLLVGPYPPPLGGVATHVQRLSHTLYECGVGVRVLNHFSHRGDNDVVVGTLRRNPLRYWWRLSHERADVVHYHHGRLSLLLATALARRRGRAARWVVTVHGHDLSRYLRHRVPTIRSLASWALRSFDCVIAVSAEVGAELSDPLGGVPVTVLPAYLPRMVPAAGDPVVGDHERTGARLAVVMYRVKPLSRDTDVYGLDVAADVFREVAAGQPEVELDIFLACAPRSWRARAYLARILRTLESAGLESRTRLRVGEDFSASLGPNMVVLRPTRTDGDAVSIRESLTAGAPVIASDVVGRPLGTSIVAITDHQAWREHAARALAQVRSGPMPARSGGSGQPGPVTASREMLTVLGSAYGIDLASGDRHKAGRPRWPAVS